MEFDNVLALLNKLDGRDQLLKTIQYGSRFWMWLLRQADEKSDLATRFEGMYKSTSTSRKAFRLLKSLHQYEKMVQAYQAKAVYYIFDNLIFFTKVKVLRISDKPLGYYGNRGWLLGSFLGALMYLHDLRKNQEKELELRRQLVAAADDERAPLLAAIAAQRDKRVDLVMNLIKSCCNSLVAANNIDYVKMVAGRKLNDGVVGILGVLAGLSSVYRVWRAIVADAEAKKAKKDKSS